MKIYNQTKKVLLASDAKAATSFLDNLLGLLNPKNPRTLVFDTRFGIHTLGLKKPIDVLVLNNNFQVIKIKESLRPNRFFFWNPKHRVVIEFPLKTISNISLGDEITFKN